MVGVVEGLGKIYDRVYDPEATQEERALSAVLEDQMNKKEDLKVALAASAQREADLQSKLDKARPAVAAMGSAIFALIAERPDQALKIIRDYAATLK